MKAYWLTLSVGVLAVIAINFLHDPAKRWHHRFYDFQKNWSATQAWVMPTGFDERLYVTSHIQKIPEIRTLMIGSSRVMLVDSNMLKDAQPLFNAGVSGATIEDYISIWQLVKNLSKLPKTVIIFVDPWVLNKNAEQERWTSWSHLYLQFRNEFSSRRSPLDFSTDYWRSLIKPTVANMSDLLAWWSLKDSLFSEAAESSNLIVEIENIPPGKGGKRFDGSIIYPAGTMKDRSLDEVRREGNAAFDNGLYSLKNWEFDPAEIEMFEALISDMVNHDVNVHIISPPYSPVVLSGMADRPEYSEVIPSLDKNIQMVLQKIHSSRVQYCKAFDSLAAGCAETDWFDAFHAKSACVQKILQFCAVTAVRN